MSQGKSVSIYGLLGDVEGSYLDGATLTEAADGILLAEEAVAVIDYNDDGQRAAPPGSAIGHQTKSAPSGRFCTLAPKVEIRGAGEAYAAGTVPQDLHTFMRMSGHTATLSDGVSWTYTPHALTTTPESAAFEALARGQQYDLIGAYATLGFLIEGPGFGILSADINAIMTTHPTDVALSAITYDSVAPPKASNMGVTIGNYTGGVSRRIEFAQNRDIATARVDHSGTAAHAGWAVGKMLPTMNMTVEADSFHGTTPWTAAAAIDPYRAMYEGTSMTLGFTLGSVAFNKMVFAAAQVQITNVADEEDGPIALWNITFQLNPSTPVLQDAYSLAFT